MPFFAFCDNVFNHACAELGISVLKFKLDFRNDPLGMCLKKTLAVREFALFRPEQPVLTGFFINRFHRAHEIAYFGAECARIAAYRTSDRTGNACELLPSAQSVF